MKCAFPQKFDGSGPGITLARTFMGTNKLRSLQEHHHAEGCTEMDVFISHIRQRAFPRSMHIGLQR